MRTTVTLDSDVAQDLKKLQRDGRSFKQVLNDALRLGLRQLRKPSPPRRFRSLTRDMGLRPGLSLDNIGELLAQIEGEDWR
jgi:hypothetical protein